MPSPLPLTLIATLCLTACAASPSAADQNAADTAARDLIERLGAQQAFAMLGWQQNADYKPADACFGAWATAADFTAPDLPDCDAHAEDLARLYASYGAVVDPVAFKSDAYWAAWESFSLAFPGLVAEWEAAGGSEDDASFLDHPVCAAPLQQGWEGSAYFYDGAEHPICRLYKIDPVAAAQWRGFCLLPSPFSLGRRAGDEGVLGVRPITYVSVMRGDGITETEPLFPNVAPPHPNPSPQGEGDAAVFYPPPDDTCVLRLRSG